MASSDRPTIQTSKDSIRAVGTNGNAVVLPTGDSVETLRQSKYFVRVHDAGPPMFLGVLAEHRTDHYQVVQGSLATFAASDLQFVRVTVDAPTAVKMPGWPPLQITVTPVAVQSGIDAVRLEFERGNGTNT